MNSKLRLTMAQALVRFLVAQFTEVDGRRVPLFPGVWAIFGHGNVSGLGEALYQFRESLPTYRAHNEQGMAMAAIAYAKATNRRQIFACTSSVGPGATNMVTASATAHVNRLPVLFLPGDTFATRAPDPVLQQVEDWGDPTITANDCFRPVSRFWDRISRPEQLLSSLPRAVQVLTDPAECGPVTLALPQDIQTEAWNYPESFFEETVHYLRRPPPDAHSLARARDLLLNAEKPLVIAGGGVLYSGAWTELRQFCEKHGVPAAETQAGKGSLPWDHEMQMGSVGVTGSTGSNALARDADIVLVAGSRLSDFTTASRSLFQNPAVKLIGLNVSPFDAFKQLGLPLVADARLGLAMLSEALGDWQAPRDWTASAQALGKAWQSVVDEIDVQVDDKLPSDAQVLKVVNECSGPDDIVVGAAGGLPGELHKLWRTVKPNRYHLEYGYSCMGYEIAGGLGVKMAFPESEVFVLAGDGSYMMLNSELATSVLLGHKLIVVVLDNSGFACINRLQAASGGAPFNNLFDDVVRAPDADVSIDFSAHARALGALAEKVGSLSELADALGRAKAANQSYVVVISTDPVTTTDSGGAWWDVAIPEVSERADVREAFLRYQEAKKKQRR